MSLCSPEDLIAGKICNCPDGYHDALKGTFAYQGLNAANEMRKLGRELLRPYDRLLAWLAAR